MRKRIPSPIAAKREAAGLTQSELARRAGITPSHLRKIEVGEVKEPSIRHGLAIAEALMVEVPDALRRLFRLAA